MTATDILAIYGALLSTAVFLWTIQTSKPLLKVRIVHSGEYDDDGQFRHGIRVQVQNPSQHEAHLHSISAVYPFRKTRLKDQLEHLIRFRSSPIHVGWCHVGLSVVDVEDGCPISIEPRKSHGVFIPNDTLAELLEDAVKSKIKFLVVDALWRRTYSKSFNVDLSDNVEALNTGR